MKIIDLLSLKLYPVTAKYTCMSYGAGTFQCRGVLLIWIIVGQGPTVLTVGAGGVVWIFFL